MGPGQSGLAEEDVNCRCTLTAVFVIEAESVAPNGQREVSAAEMRALLTILERV